MSDESPTPLERVIAAEGAATRELTKVPEWIWDGETLPVPIEAICDSHYGLLIEEHDDLAVAVGMPTDTHLSGLLFPDAREVWVNAGEAPVRRRFTVGHELGHWVMHAGRGHFRHEPVVHCRESEVREEAGGESDTGDGYLDYPPAELDANQFAAALLMPAGLIPVDERQGSGDEILCRALGVSAEALERRRWFLNQGLSSISAGAHHHPRPRDATASRNPSE